MQQPLEFRQETNASAGQRQGKHQDSSPQRRHDSTVAIAGFLLQNPDWTRRSPHFPGNVLAGIPSARALSSQSRSGLWPWLGVMAWGNPDQVLPTDAERSRPSRFRWRWRLASRLAIRAFSSRRRCCSRASSLFLAW